MKPQYIHTLTLATLANLATLSTGQAQSFLRRQQTSCYSISPSVPDGWCPTNNCPADGCAPGSAPTPIPNCKSTGYWSDTWCQTHGCPSTYCATTSGSTPAPTKVPTRGPTTAPATGGSPTKSPTTAPTTAPTTGASCYSISPSVPDTWCPSNDCPASSCVPGPAPAPITNCKSTGYWSDSWCQTHGCPSKYCATTSGSTLAPTTKVPTKAPTTAPATGASPTKSPTKKPTTAAPTKALTTAPITTTKSPTKAPTTNASTGNPTTATPPTGSTTGGVYFSPYDDVTLNVKWSNAINDLIPEDLVTISSNAGLKRLTAAFITASTSGCTAGWGGSTSYPATGAKPWGKSVFDALKTSGRGLVISFGGAAGTDISAYCDVASLISTYQQIIDAYGPERIDFDIEGSFLSNTAAIVRMVTALKTIQANNPKIGISFTLPVMPYGLLQNAKDMVNQAIAAGLTFQVAIMTMDYGDSYSGNQATYAMQAGDNVVTFLQSVYPSKPTAQLYAMLILIPMIGVNDVASNVFKLADADTLNAYAKSKGLGGLSMWSLNRDHPCSGGTGNFCSGGTVQTADYDFSKHFAA